ncbi:toxin TcdB middle/N-terminal domain-containing protein [Planctomycetota bacterium]
MSTNVISLPSPPGTIKGLGEAFKPMLNTGTAKYAVSFDVPPGTKGHAPQLALTYDSGRGTSPCGIGWRIGPGPIKRQTNKGLPLYVDGRNQKDDDWDGTTDEPDEIDTFLGPDGEELVELEDGTLRAKIESAFARYQRQGSGWIVHLRNGTCLEYGLHSTAQVTDSTSAQIYQWLLEKSTDTNGNTIDYSYYTHEDTGFEASENQKYLKEIRYGPGAGPWMTCYVVQFAYEDRFDWYMDYSAGFPICMTRRLKRVAVGFETNEAGLVRTEPHPLNADRLTLIRRYDLGYEDGLSCSRLVGITQVGADGVSTLPSVTLSYASEQTGTVLKATNAQIDCQNTPYTVMDSELAELVDLNADSLPDILLTDHTGKRHTAFMNMGVDLASGKLCWDQVHTVESDDGFSTGMDLSSQSVHLADMDGDGKADLVYTSPWKEVSYHSNTGRGRWGHRCHMGTQGDMPPAPYSDDDIRLSDLDGDTCIDVVRSTATGYSLWFNRGQGQYSREVRTAGAVYNGRAIQFSDTAVHLTDLNGDKLNDVVQMKPTHLIYCAHMGFGRYATGLTISIPDKVLSTGPNGQVERARLEDINSDGLADLIVERATVNTCWIWLNRGTRGTRITLSPCIVVTDMPLIRDSRTVTRWADMNGNGTTDLVYACSTSEPRLRCVDLGLLIRSTDGSGPTNMLLTIDNGLGSTTTVHYSPSTEMYVQAARDKDKGRAWETTLPIPVHVVSETQVDVATVNGADRYQTSYQYWDGYYDTTEKEFWGFAREETTQLGDDSAPTVYTASEFHTGVEHECLKGKVKALEICDSTKRYTRQENSWEFRVLHQGIDGRDVAFAYNTQTLSKIYEGLDTPKYLLTQYSVDGWGHVVEELDYGVVGDTTNSATYSDLNDEILTYTTYEPNTITWLLDLKAQEEVKDNHGDRKAAQQFTYDSAGNFLGQDAWLDTNHTWIPVVRNEYDEYGNIVTIVNANDHYRTIEYDSLFHMYPVSESIHFTQYTSANNPEPGTVNREPLTLKVNYHYGFGQIAEATDFTGNRSTFSYDCFGRLLQITRPCDAWERFAYALGSPVSHILSQKRESLDSNSTLDSILFFDGLGRKLGSKIEAAPDPNTGLDRWRYVEAVSFNQRGLEQYKWLPYFSDSNEYEMPDANQSYVALEYDAQDRVVKTVNPDLTFATVVHEPLRQHLFDENDNSDSIGTPKTLVYDGQERLIEVIERNREEGSFYSQAYDVNEYRTTYQWTILGDLARITDAHDNVKILTYDSLRRKTFMNDPDRGHMHYGYDWVGNLTWTQDAKGQEIEYRYDAAERLAEEDWLVPRTDSVEVSYHYDQSRWGDDPNTRGKLAWVEDQVGVASYVYDARGNIVQTVRGIKDANGLEVDYVTSYRYDSMDRVQTLIAHNSQPTNYTYDLGGAVKAITAAGTQIVNHINYTASGQQERTVYGNNTQTNYHYDLRQCLARLNTFSTRSGQDLLNYAYQYDSVSNITHIIDQRPSGGMDNESQRRNTQCFAYDDLYRLNSVRYARQNNLVANHGQINYQYDAIGNMRYKSSPLDPNAIGHISDDKKVNIQNMEYEGGRYGRQGRDPGDLPGPHALTHTGNNGTYQYDRNGNMTQIEGADCTWDYRDRLVTYAKEEVTAHYTYDYTGRRIIKEVNDANGMATTLYPDRTFEVRPQNKHVMYAFNGDVRLAQHNNDPNGQAQWLFYHSDHLGSSNAMTDVKGVLVQEMAYYPFGCMRNEYNSQIAKANYGFAGKEKDDESGLQYFEARYLLGHAGRFLSYDPLANKNPNTNPYVYSLNNPLKYIDPYGLEAWEVNAKWDNETIGQYREYVAMRADEYVKNGTKSTCEDFALNVLIDFASQNGLPVSISTGSGVFNASSDDYSNVDSFRTTVLTRTGASDLQKDENTRRIDIGNASKGDLVLSTNERGRADHTQLITSKSSDVIGIHQGNYRKDRLSFVSYKANPKDPFFYKGSKIQQGKFVKDSGTQTYTYTREGNSTRDAMRKFGIQVRTWNFEKWNK